MDLYRYRCKNGTYQIIPGELGNDGVGPANEEGQGFSSQTVSISDKTTTGVYQAGGSTKRYDVCITVFSTICTQSYMFLHQCKYKKSKRVFLYVKFDTFIYIFDIF